MGEGNSRYCDNMAKPLIPLTISVILGLIVYLFIKDIQMFDINKFIIVFLVIAVMYTLISEIFEGK
jgi:predicted neutral ceramidase superfamily lipid hydrolase